MERAVDNKAMSPQAAALRLAPWLLLALAAILAIASLAVHAAALRQGHIVRIMPATSIAPSAGHMFVVTMPDLQASSDTNETPQRSPYRLLENGVAIGTPHSAHQDIIDKGDGRFSHWHDVVYISTSDNSDPLRNGRIYSLERDAPPDSVGGMLAVVSGLFGLAGLAAVCWRLRRRMSATTVLFAMNCVAALALLWAFVGLEQRSPLDTRQAGAVGGHAWSAPLPALQGSSDVNGAPRRSELQVFENGTAIGPAHSLHADIIASGAGRYSHWGANVILSATDNSDVRSNGRVYEIVHPVRPPWWADLAVLALWLAAFVMAAGERAGAISRIDAAAGCGALVRSGGVAIAAGGLGALALGIVVASVGDPDAGAALLEHLRQIEQIVAGLALAVAGGAALAWRTGDRPVLATARVVVGALIVAMVLYGIFERDYGLTNQSPAMAIVLLAALAGAFILRFRAPRVWRQMREQAVGLLPPAKQHIRLAVIACCALTVIQLLPEVYNYWDQSGWNDSDSYDNIGAAIARGATPLGDGHYPPVYQFGLAALYWTFGHFFFVQQLANLALALLTTASLCLAAWLFYRNLFVVWLAGLFAAHWEPLHHATWYTQIEGWYVPIFAVSLLALAWYLRQRTLWSALLLGIAAAVVMATRQQGVFYAAGLGLAVFVAAGLPMKERLKHLLVFCAALVLIGIAPWSARNYVVEGRFAPTSNQSIEGLVILNDPRVPLYGIRYWESWDALYKEWVTRYPDEHQRYAAMSAEYVKRVTQDPMYFVNAAPWRAAVFYGLLPDGVVNGTSTMSQFWADPLPHIEQTFRFWAPLLASLLGLVFAVTQRRAWLLALLVPANVVVGLLVGSAEPRLCYPVLALNLLLALAAVAPMAPAGPLPEPAGAITAPQARPRRSWLALAGVAIVALALLRILVGEPNAIRPIMSAKYVLEPKVTIDQTLPEVVQIDHGMTVDGASETILTPGKRYRLKAQITNSQFPPRYATGLPGVDPGRYQRGAVQYFKIAQPMWTYATPSVVLSFESVEATQPLKEGMTIEAEIVAEPSSTVFDRKPIVNWVRVEKAVILGVER